MLSRSSLLWKKALPKYAGSSATKTQNVFCNRSIHTLLKNNQQALYLRSNQAMVQFPLRCMNSQKKVVFSENPTEASSKNEATNKDFQNKLKQTPKQIPKQTPQQTKAKNMREAREAYLADRKQLHETLRDKWVHNASKSFTEDRFEDSIHKSHSKHTRKANLKWLESAENYALKSSDPYSALLSNVINSHGASQKIDVSNIEARINATIKRSILRFMKNKEKCLKAELKEPFEQNILTYLLVDPKTSLQNKEFVEYIQTIAQESLFPENGQILDIKELKISEEMATKIVFLNLVKKYNFFQGIDVVFRELAKVLIELRQEGVTEPAQNYQDLLNSNFFVSKQKEAGFEADLESIPINESILRQPDFTFGGGVQKVQVIQKYKKMLSEFDRVKHYHNFLRNSLDDPTQFSKLMSSQSELEALLASINEETEHITDDGTLDKISKVGGIYDEVVRSYVKTTFGIEDIGIHNMYQVYDPLKNGQFDDLLSVRDRLVKDGLSLEEADRLAEEYIVRSYEDSKGPHKFYTLIESHLDESQEAISDFYSTETMRDVKFNVPTPEDFEFSLQDRKRKAGHLRSYLMAGGDLNEYNKLSNTVFRNKLENEPVRLKRPSLAHFSTRSFCSKPQTEEPKKGGFTQYLKKLVQVDSEKEQEEKKKLEDIINKDPADIKIGFQKIKSSIKIENSSPEVGHAAEEEIVQNIRTPQDLLLEEANKRFDVEFFKEFSLADEKLMQINLEEYIRDMDNLEEIPYFAMSFLSNALELNNWIENTHLLFYKIFCTPKINKDERKEGEKSDILAGNLFKNSVSSYGYRSLLHTVLLKGKKKHFKKILKHIDTHVPVEDITDDIVADVIKVAQHLDCPILLGKTMKDFMAKGVSISKKNCLDFLLYLDMCKGFEKDTLKFLYFSNETGNIQINWDSMKGFFYRALNYKSGGDIMKFYNEVKDNLTLNKHNLSLPEKEQEELLEEIKLEICTQMVNASLRKKAFILVDSLFAEYTEMTLERRNPNDLLGLKINTAKTDINAFEETLNDILQGDFGDQRIEKETMETIAGYISKFRLDDDAAQSTEFIKKFLLKMSSEGYEISDHVYRTFIGMILKYQNWDLLEEMLDKTDDEIIGQDFGTLQQLKESLIYCVDTNQRADIRDKLDKVRTV